VLLLIVIRWHNTTWEIGFVRN